MKTLFASLHTAEPATQTDHEAAYTGYRRVPIDYADGFGDIPVTIVFPRIEQTAAGQITHVGLGTAEKGNGDVELTIHAMPYIRMAEDACPRIVVTNVAADGLPAQLNPVARVAFNLYRTGQLDPADLHPALYEVINEALHGVGVSVIPVARGGAASMTGRLENMPSLGDWGHA